MANTPNSEGYKPSKVKYFAIGLTIVVVIMNIVDLIGKGGPQETMDYVSIGLMIACILLSIFIVRTEKKKKEEWEEYERMRIEKRNRRRNNKKK